MKNIILFLIICIFSFTYSICHATSINIHLKQEHGSPSNVSIILDDNILEHTYIDNFLEYNIHENALLKKNIWDKRTIIINDGHRIPAKISAYLFGHEETITLHIPPKERINSTLLQQYVKEYQQIVIDLEAAREKAKILSNSPEWRELEDLLDREEITPAAMESRLKKLESDKKTTVEAEFFQKKIRFFQEKFLTLEIGISGIQDGSVLFPDKDNRFQIALMSVYLDATYAYNALDKMEQYTGKPRTIILGENIDYAIKIIDQNSQIKNFHYNLSDATGLSKKTCLEVVDSLRPLLKDRSKSKAKDMYDSDFFIHNAGRHLIEEMKEHPNYTSYSHKRSDSDPNYIHIRRLAAFGHFFYGFLCENSQKNGTTLKKYLQEKKLSDERKKFPLKKRNTRETTKPIPLQTHQVSPSKKSKTPQW